MKTIQEIIQEYTNADFSTRLNLFMQHRRLRHEFLDIDKSETSILYGCLSKQSQITNAIKPSLLLSVLNLRDFVRSCFAKCCKN